MALLLLAIVVLLAGAGLVIAGLRGRRIDDHPLCRRCGFDLTGRPPDSQCCPECGADVTSPAAIRIGHRQRRGGLLAGGAVLSLSTLALLAVFISVKFGQLDPTPYKPFWWLKHDFQTGGTLKARALAELQSRLDAKRLSAAQSELIVDLCLTDQGDSSKAWLPAEGQFIETLQGDGMLDRQRWATYARQVFGVELKVRQIVRQGDPVPISVSGPTVVRLGAAKFTAVFDWAGYQIDGKSVGKLPQSRLNGAASHHGRIDYGVNNGGCNYYVPQIDGSASKTLAPGLHALSVKMKFYLFAASDVPNTGDPSKPTDPEKQLATFILDLPQTLNICIPTNAPPVVTVDTSLRKALLASVKVRSITVDAAQKRVSIDSSFNDPPVRLKFRAIVRPAGSTDPHAEIDFGMEDADAHGNWGYSFGREGSLKGSKLADMIFRPDLKGLRDSVDMTLAWGEEVIIKNIPVTQQPARP